MLDGFGFTRGKVLLEREQLDRRQKLDLKKATLARLSAYAPNSNFLVGAAIRTNDGKVYPGWNVENIVYAGAHAEGTAITRMTPESRESGIHRVTVVGGPRGMEDYDIPTLPCGICRQFLYEFVREGDDPEVISAGIKGQVLRMYLRDLLPEAFYPEILKKK